MLFGNDRSRFDGTLNVNPVNIFVVKNVQVFRQKAGHIQLKTDQDIARLYPGKPELYSGEPRRFMSKCLTSTPLDMEIPAFGPWGVPCSVSSCPTVQCRRSFNVYGVFINILEHLLLSCPSSTLSLICQVVVLSLVHASTMSRNSFHWLGMGCRIQNVSPAGL